MLFIAAQAQGIDFPVLGLCNLVGAGYIFYILTCSMSLQNNWKYKWVENVVISAQTDVNMDAIFSSSELN